MSTLSNFVSALSESKLFSEAEARELSDRYRTPFSEDAAALATQLVDAGKLTRYAADELLAGHTKRLVMGDYFVLFPLGAGGMGQVFKAHHRRLKRDVAIKVLPPGVLEAVSIKDTRDAADARERFEREMHALARLEHPNIVIAHDAGEVDGAPYLVMQYVEGEDLATILRTLGPMAVDDGVNAVMQAAKGLEYAHNKGVIHRDLKPANLLRTPDGTVKLLDMGLARLSANSEETATNALTASGQIMGTVDFMAPEQAEDTHQADERSDIYGLGCTFYSLLTARPIYEGTSVVKKILAHRDQPVPSLRQFRPEISTELDAIFQKMVAKNPDDRFQSMTQLLAALNQCPRIDPAASPDGAVAAPHDATIELSQRQLSEQMQMAVTSRNVEVQPIVTGQAETPTLRSETTAFNKEQKHHGRFRARTLRQRRRLGPIFAVLLLLLLLAGTGLMLYDERFDYLGIQKFWKPTPKPPLSLFGEQHTTSTGSAPVEFLAVRPDATMVVSGNEGELRVSETRSKRVLLTLKPRVGRLASVTMSPDGSWIAAGGSGGLRVWDALNGDIRNQLSTDQIVSSVAFSPKSKWIALAQDNILLGDVVTGDTAGAIQRAHKGSIHCLAFSPNGKLLASAGADGAVKLWDIVSSSVQRQIVEIDMHGLAGSHSPAVVRHVLFSPNGRLLASADALGRIKLWQAPDWKLRGQLQGPTSGIGGIAFLAGGRLLVAGGKDDKVRIWQLSDNTLLKELQPGSEKILSLGVDRGARVLVCGDKKGDLHVWDFNPAALPRRNPESRDD